MADGLIRKRCVFHVPGYDPAAPEAVKARFERELKRFEKTWSVKAAVSDGVDKEHWGVTASGPNWHVETQYRLVGWDEVIAEAGAETLWTRIPKGLLAFVDFTVFALPRYFVANWRYAGFFLYPLVAFIGLYFLSAAIGRYGTEFTGHPLAGLAIGIASFFLLWRWPGRRIFLHLLFDDWIFSRRYLRYGDPIIDAKLDQTARELIAASQDGQTDEIAVIGHSLGAVLAIELLDRALQLEPAIAKKGPPIVLISVGSSILKIGLHSGARRFHAAAQRLAGTQGIFWGDYQAIADIMNFYKSDPLTAMGMPTRDIPLVRVVRIRHMLDPKIYKSIRFRPLRMHLQFVSGNNLRYAYDYFMLICGPLGIERQMRGNGAVKAIDKDGSLKQASA